MPSKSTPLELVPASITAQAKPIPDPGWVERRLATDRTASACPEISGVETAATSIEQADNFFRAMYAAVMRAIEDGDRKSVQKIMRDHPDLLLRRDIVEVLARWTKNGSLRGLPGRPPASGAWSPVFVVVMVDYLISTGRAENKEQAFKLLSPFGLGYDSAKRLDAQARREPRFQALLITDESRACPLDTDTARLISQAQRLSPGSPVVRHVSDPTLGGDVRVEFTAEAPAAKPSPSGKARRSKKPFRSRTLPQAAPNSARKAARRQRSRSS